MIRQVRVCGLKRRAFSHSSMADLEACLVDEPDACLVQPEEILHETSEVDPAVRDVEEGESSAIAAEVESRDQPEATVARYRTGLTTGTRRQ